MRTIDLLCIGHAAYDLTMAVAHHPGPDEKCSASRLAECGGGPAANAAVAAVRLGGRAAFAGYLGRDLFGGAHLRELEAEGVDTRLVVRGEAPTPLSCILAKPDGARTVVNYKGETSPLAAGAIRLDGRWPRAVLFDGHEPFASVPIARAARQRGIPTVLDAGSVHRGTRELAPLVDHVVASERFARDFTGEVDRDAALEALAARFPCVVVTLGAHGVIWARGTGRGRLPALPVEAIDSTGAGDAFHGAWALGLARGMAWEDLVRFASAAGALACTRLGARHALPGVDAVERLLDGI